MSKKKKYDLIYVPAETAHVLLLGVDGGMLSVLHENKKWFIEKKQMRGIYDQFN